MVIKSPGLATVVGIWNGNRRKERPRRFHLTEAASLRGRVIGPDGSPVPDVVIYPPDVNAPIEGVQTATTDSDGYFEISDMSPMDLGADAVAASTSVPSGGDFGFGGWLNLRLKHPDFGIILAG